MRTEKLIKIKLDVQKDILENLEKDFWSGKYDGNFLHYSSLKDLLLSAIDSLEWVLED